MAVMLELAPGDTLVVGNGTRIRMVAKSGQRARLAIDSREDVERVKAGEAVPPMDQPAKKQAITTPMAAVPTPASNTPQPFLRRQPAT